MRLVAATLALITLSAAFPLVAADDECAPSHCKTVSTALIPGDPAQQAVYVWHAVPPTCPPNNSACRVSILWLESNKTPGLQRSTTTDAAGKPVKPDTIVLA